MGDFQESFLSGANIDFIEGLFARYLENPASVDSSWRELFDGQKGRGEPVFGIPQNGAVAALAPSHAPASPPAKATNGHGATPVAAPPDTNPAQIMALQARVDQLVTAFRLRGHLLANLDPLGRPRPPLDHIADVGMAKQNHFSDAELEETIDSSDIFPTKRVKVRDLVERLRRTYCGSIGVEFATVLNSDRRRWLMPRMEHSENRSPLSEVDQGRILTKLSYAEGFESFLHTKYRGMKRFGLDGSESLIPMLDALLDEGGKLGVREVVIGMAHRGRLNVLANILGKSTDEIFSEFEGPLKPEAFLSRGDVKYHQGFSSDYVTASEHKIHLSLAFNPSHLEFVYPVVVGRVRAKQERFQDVQRKAVVPVVLHGDAAMAGQGVVAETLNLAELAGYTVGGTVHIVINNQVGFTTDPQESRSSLYATAVAQMLDIPIFHVNGDDPEACVHVMRLAMQYRQQFNSDVVVDLNCFRRYGHNEGDEPAFTQPQMYELIRKHPGVRQLYANQLVQRSRMTEEKAEAIRAKCQAEFQESLSRVHKERMFKEPSALEGLWRPYAGGLDRAVPQVNTGIEKGRLQTLIAKLSELPAGFTPHPNLVKVLTRRKQIAEGKEALDWSAGELLAYATLLTDGTPVRLSGQDCERGTFSHRHAVMHDVNSGARHAMLQGLSADQATFSIYNSPLSELGCLGFEFGYSLDMPQGLVIWEAQYGDFVNGAQVILDQFVVASEHKWKRLCGLTLLLPHGYEGQGPEHSSARLERFLELCGNDNIQVCYPTTPAQIFHLLRRQVVRPLRKPLVVMSPKSLLRNPRAQSSLDELTSGTFSRIIPDVANVPLDQVSRLLLCTGKVYYDLLEERERINDLSVAIVRVEQLYPFPREELTALLAQMPKLTELWWVQEEPRNMGAWRYMLPLLSELSLGTKGTHPAVGFVGRAESASPATGYLQAHALEQKLLVQQALTREAKNGR